ncbi:MAG: hypothetical protein AAF492_07485 [Verrucomicrobiota bacterium]
MKISPKLFESLLPHASKWAAEKEAEILERGVPLTEQELADAAKIPVQSPEKVRLLKLDRVPTPKHLALKAAVKSTGLLGPGTSGLTLRYGIYIRSDCWGDRRLVIHELVHTAQYERLGSIEAFLRQYLHECLTVGYHASPLEQEAVERARELG